MTASRRATRLRPRTRAILENVPPPSPSRCRIFTPFSTIALILLHPRCSPTNCCDCHCKSIPHRSIATLLLPHPHETLRLSSTASAPSPSPRSPSRRVNDSAPRHGTRFPPRLSRDRLHPLIIDRPRPLLRNQSIGICRLLSHTAAPILHVLEHLSTLIPSILKISTFNLELISL